MPKSKKRVSKPKEEVQVAYKNPLHTGWGRATIILLASIFVVGVVAGLIAVVVEYVN